MNNITIQEEYTLPSMGQIYAKPFDPTVKLRSMTTVEEMKRLTVTESPFKSMSEIIDDCIVNKLPMSVYDLCLGDYQYLLHKLRVVTYGPEYAFGVTCPFCGESFDGKFSLDELDVHTYDPSVDELSIIELPVSKNIIKLKFQTPRTLDNIEKRKKAMKQQFPEMTEDPTLMLNIESVIDTIDGQPVNPATIQTYIKKLSMRDTNLILNRARKMNEKVGVDTRVTFSCPNCARDIITPFRFTSDF